MTDNLEHEFFTKVKGWEQLLHDVTSQDYGYWVKPGSPRNCSERRLPPISTSWDAFHEWVVPELMRKCHEMNAYDNQAFIRKCANYLGAFLIREDGPQRALEWAMKELRQ